MNATPKSFETFGWYVKNVQTYHPSKIHIPIPELAFVYRSSQYPYSGVVSIAIKTPSISTKDKLGYKFQVPSFKWMWIILQLKNFKAFATNALNL